MPPTTLGEVLTIILLDSACNFLPVILCVASLKQGDMNLRVMRTHGTMAWKHVQG